MALWEEDDYGAIANKVCWAEFALTFVIVALRLACRSGRAGLGADDYITVGCLTIILLTNILLAVGTSFGLGRHAATLSPSDTIQALKWDVIVSAVLIWAFSLPKFAIVAILKRVLDYGTPTVVLFWGLALTSQACILATSVWWFVQCRPVARGWDASVEGTCASVSVLADLGYFTSAYSAFLDIFFALYPVPAIMRLNMPLKTRLAVASALGLSGLACVVSVYKLAIFGQVFEIMEEDPTYPVPFLDILGLTEGNILIICASLPTLGPLVPLVRGKVGTSAGSKERSHNQLGSGDQVSPLGNSWNTLRGHKLVDPEHSSKRRPSLDDIPLVGRTKSC